jgi:site-specific recombinase XerD
MSDREDEDRPAMHSRDLWGQIAWWTATLAVEESLDPKTAALYGHAVRQFAAWLHARRRRPAAADTTSMTSMTSVAGVTEEDAQAYREALLATGRAPGTINRALTALRLFFDGAVSGAPPGLESGSGPEKRLMPNPFRAIPLVPRR